MSFVKESGFGKLAGKDDVTMFNTIPHVRNHESLITSLQFPIVKEQMVGNSSNNRKRDVIYFPILAVVLASIVIGLNSEYLKPKVAHNLDIRRTRMDSISSLKNASLVVIGPRNADVDAVISMQVKLDNRSEYAITVDEGGRLSGVRLKVRREDGTEVELTQSGRTKLGITDIEVFWSSGSPRWVKAGGSTEWTFNLEDLFAVEQSELRVCASVDVRAFINGKHVATQVNSNEHVLRVE